MRIPFRPQKRKTIKQGASRQPGRPRVQNGAFLFLTSHREFLTSHASRCCVPDFAGSVPDFGGLPLYGCLYGGATGICRGEARSGQPYIRACGSARPVSSLGPPKPTLAADPAREIRVGYLRGGVLLGVRSRTPSNTPPPEIAHACVRPARNFKDFQRTQPKNHPQFGRKSFSYRAKLSKEDQRNREQNQRNQEHKKTFLYRPAAGATRKP